jgi:excisionase family DNA binding protein
MAKPDPQFLAEPLLNASEAARLLRVPRSTLYELVRSRGLPHVRVGRALRFSRQGLSAWITANSYGLQTLGQHLPPCLAQAVSSPDSPAESSSSGFGSPS